MRADAPQPPGRTWAEGRLTTPDGTVTVEVALDGKLPEGARAEMSIDGTIEIDRLQDVLYTGRPSYGQPESSVGLFKLEPDGKHATRVTVQLGRASVSQIEVRGGLQGAGSDADFSQLRATASWFLGIGASDEQLAASYRALGGCE